MSNMYAMGVKIDRQIQTMKETMATKDDLGQHMNKKELMQALNAIYKLCEQMDQRLQSIETSVTNARNCNPDESYNSKEDEYNIASSTSGIRHRVNVQNRKSS